jgi:NhaP-type Na+/H+ or K+/H+ antiporter
VAALKWRSTQFEEQIQNNLKVFWLIFQPFLFALIGAEVKVSDMTGNAIGLALLSLLIGLTIRMITSALVVFGADLNLKEKLFISLAWLPKATVQAAIGPIALDFAREKEDLRDKELATLVLTIAVLSILITAPLGAIAISTTGPKLLNKSKNSEVTQFNSYTVEANKKTKDFEKNERPVILVVSNLERVDSSL